MKALLMAETKLGPQAPVLKLSQRVWYHVCLFLTAKEFALAANTLSTHQTIPKEWQETRLRQLLLYLNKREPVMLQLRRRYNWTHFECLQRAAVEIRKPFLVSRCCRQQKEIFDILERPSSFWYLQNSAMIPGTSFGVFKNLMVDVQTGEIRHEFDPSLKMTAVGFQTFLAQHDPKTWSTFDIEPNGQIKKTVVTKHMIGLVCYMESPPYNAVSPSWIVTHVTTQEDQFTLRIVHRKDETSHDINVYQLFTVDQKKECRPKKSYLYNASCIDEDRQLLTSTLCIDHRQTSYAVFVYSLETRASRFIVHNELIRRLSPTSYLCGGSMYDVEMGCLDEKFLNLNYFVPTFNPVMVQCEFDTQKDPHKVDIHLITSQRRVHFGQFECGIPGNFLLNSPFVSNEQFLVCRQGTMLDVLKLGP
jgi:hypothetical protein